jgi:hypothetical protein
MKYLVASLAAVLLAAPIQAAEPLSEAVTGEWVVAAFKELCADPFGDRGKLTEAVSRFDPSFEAVAPDTEAPMPGSSGWRSPKAILNYTDGTFLPRPLPSPQCSFSARPDAAYDHSATAAALASALSLPAAKAKGKAGRFQSEWNFKGPAGEKRRLFLSQEPRAEGPLVRISLLNLR